MAASGHTASAAGAPLRLVLVGAAGRMGREIVRALPAFSGLRLTGAVVSADSALLGRDAGTVAGTGELGVRLSAELAPLLCEADVALDFSTAAAAASHLSACASARVPLLIGTTGLGPELEPAIVVATRVIPVLLAPNTSLAVALLLELVRRAAQKLPASFDIEIVEAHHRAKRDAPSGTALALAEAALQARGGALERDACLSRPRSGGGRQTGEVGFAVVRGGDVIGEHRVLFLGEGERLELAHSVGDRAVFARGALSGARWLARRAAGRYGMQDLFSSDS